MAGVNFSVIDGRESASLLVGWRLPDILQKLPA